MYMCIQKRRMSNLIHPPLTYSLSHTHTHTYTHTPVPTPTVTTITQPPDATMVTGSSITLVCRVDLNEAVDTPVVVETVWRRSGLTLSTDDRIIISDVERTGPFRYESNLTFTTLSTQDSGMYNCDVTVNPQPTSPFIIGTTGTATTTLNVTGR